MSCTKVFNQFRIIHVCCYAGQCEAVTHDQGATPGKLCYSNHTYLHIMRRYSYHTLYAIKKVESGDDLKNNDDDDNDSEAERCKNKSLHHRHLPLQILEAEEMSRHIYQHYPSFPPLGTYHPFLCTPHLTTQCQWWCQCQSRQKQLSSLSYRNQNRILRTKENMKNMMNMMSTIMTNMTTVIIMELWPTPPSSYPAVTVRLWRRPPTHILITTCIAGRRVWRRKLEKTVRRWWWTRGILFFRKRNKTSWGWAGSSLAQLKLDTH